MNKELQALEKIVNNYHIDNMNKEISIIENALKDYEIEYNIRNNIERMNYKLIKEVRESISKTKLLKYLNWLIDENEFDIKIARELGENERVIIADEEQIKTAQFLIKMINEGNFDNE